MLNNSLRKYLENRNVRSNFAFEADAVGRRTVSSSVRAPRGSTRRYVAKTLCASMK